MYGGQEAGLDRSLKFFDKDPIEWKDHTHAALFCTLFHLKHKNQALWNGKYGGEMVRITNDKMDKVISFHREKNNDAVLLVMVGIKFRPFFMLSFKNLVGISSGKND